LLDGVLDELGALGGVLSVIESLSLLSLSMRSEMKRSKKNDLIPILILMSAGLVLNFDAVGSVLLQCARFWSDEVPLKNRSNHLRPLN
jgi:hypothetical protein